MTLLAIAAMAGVVFLLRIGGFVLAGSSLPATSDRLLRFVPVAVLAALTVSLVTRQARADGWTLIAVAVGAAAAYFTRQLWVCIVAGVVTYWMLELIVSIG